MNFLGQMNSRPPMSSIISKKQFMYVQGTVTGISNFSANGCTKLFSSLGRCGPGDTMGIKMPTVRKGWRAGL